MRNPRIPMTPEQLPEQRIYVPEGRPRRPENFEAIVSWDAHDLPEAARLKGRPRSATYLFQAEWAWSPMNNRLSAFYLHRGRRFWSVFERYFDDNWMRWEWQQRAVLPLAQATERQAAFWLMVELMKFDRNRSDVEEWHWIGETATLDIPDIKAIAHEVWGKWKSPERRVEDLRLP